MSSVIRNLLVRLGVDADDSQARNFDQAIAGAKRTMVAAAAAAGTLAAGLGAIVRSTANTGDEAAKMGKELGTSAEAMQELEFAASITGTSVAEISTGLRRLNRGAVDASQGVGRAGDAFKKLNIEVKDGQGEFRDSLDIFEETIGALTDMESNVERAAMAQDLLGRSGTRLLRIAERGGMSIGELRDQAQSLGFVMSDEAAEQSEEFNDALTMMQFWLRGVRNQIGLAFMPQLTAAINRTREWLGANRAIIDAGVERGIDLIRDAIDGVRQAASRIDEIVNEWTDWHTVITTIGSAIAGLGILKFLPMLIAAVKGVAAVVAALLGPLGLKIAAFVALALVIQDLVVWLRGGESVIGSFIEALDFGGGRIHEFIGIVRDFAAALRDTLEPVFYSLMDAVRSFGGVLGTAAQLWWAIASRWFGLIIDVILNFWGVMTRVWGAVITVIAPVLSWVFREFAALFDFLQEVLAFFLAVVEGDFDSFAEIIQAAFEIIQGRIEHFTGFWIDLFESAGDAVFGIFERIFEWIGERIDATIGRIVGAIDRVKGLADGIRDVGEGAREMAGRIPGVGRLVGGNGAADDAANSGREQAVQNTANAMSRGDTVIDIDVAGTNASADQIAGTVQEQIRRQMERDRRQAAAAFGGGDI